MKDKSNYKVIVYSNKEDQYGLDSRSFLVSALTIGEAVDHCVVYFVSAYRKSWVQVKASLIESVSDAVVLGELK